MRFGRWLSSSLLVACALGAACSPSSATDAGVALDLGFVCRSFVDCEDGVFCNGTEQCAPGMPGADARGCLRALAGPCPGGLQCDEAARACRLPDAGASEAGPRCDVDGDGVNGPQCGGTDCDDNDPDRFPGNRERCNGALRDGRPAAPHDEDCNPCTVYDPATPLDGDLDADRFAAASCSNPWLGASAPTSCDPSLVRADPAGGHAQLGVDCNDGLRSVNPNASEVCGNSLDDNCDGRVDEPETITVYSDSDRDGFGDQTGLHGVTMRVSSCAVPAGFSTSNTDCDDARPETHPGALEQCDGLDNDCSLAGSAAGGADPTEDADGDGHSPPGALCRAPGDPGGIPTSFPRDDCDDTVASVHPGTSYLEERASCNNTDNDCDPSTTELGSACAPQGVCSAGGSCGRALVAVQLAASGNSTCARYADGTVRCWGSNSNGQLGLGSVGGSAPPALVQGLTDAVELVVGDRSACARRATGTVVCWGADDRGQLGNGAPLRDSPVPVEVLGVARAVGLASGAEHVCALLVGGAARCWGNGSAGQLGDGTTAASQPNPVTVLGLRGATQLAAGARHTLALQGDGSILAWGYNANGQLGDGTTTSRALPLTGGVGAGLARSLSAGANHSCAVRMDGSASCWGSDASGETGAQSPTATRTLAAVVLGVSGIASLDGGLSFTCATLADRTARCWGAGASGQLGSGAANSATPLVLPGGGYVEVVAGSLHACARTEDSQVFCWGNNASQQLGASALPSPSPPTSVSRLPLVRSLGLGWSLGCALLGDGSSRCWGGNNVGQLGDGTLTPRLLPAPTLLPSAAVALDAGPLTACAVLEDGTVSCWGSGVNGQLGDGTTLSRSTPGLVLLPPDALGLVSPLSHAAQVAVGQLHACARLDGALGGGVRCWGGSSSGMAGDGAPGTTLRLLPSTVLLAGTGAPLLGTTDLGAGTNHSCAVDSGGLVHCWGNNGQGQLGDGSTSNRNAAVQVAGLNNAVQVALGTAHTCARLADRTVSCWGNNDHGELGDGSTTSRRAPLPVLGLTDAVWIAAGPGQPATPTSRTCAVRAGGTVQCWGAGFGGELGNNTASSSSVPVTVLTAEGGPLDRVARVYVGMGLACALRDDASVYCWGGAGRTLGTGSVDPSLVAVPLLSF